jgi:membrane fusion protein (multidrug efflux system)
MKHGQWAGMAGLTALVAAGSGLLGWWWAARDGASSEGPARTGEPGGEPAAQVQVAPLRRGTIEETLVAYGNVVAALGETETFSVPFESLVRRVAVVPRQVIAAGDPLVEIEPSPDAVLELAQAKGERSTARQELGLVRQRVQMQLATRQEQLEAERREREADLRVQSLEQRGIGGPQVIVASAAGIVNRIGVQQGQIVAAGVALVETIGEEQIAVRLGIESEDIGALAVGQAVRLVPVNAPRLQPVSGEVRLITRQVDPDTRLVDVFVAPAPDARLLLEDHVRGEVVIRSQGALLAPRAAVLPAEGRRVLFTVADGRAVRHEVVVGTENDAEVQLLSDGLQEGQPVIVVGNGALEDGAAVVAEPAR